MATTIEHRRIQQIMNSLGEAKVVNLDMTLRQMMEPVAAHLKDVGGEVALHFVCCNEYGLITGLTGMDMREVRESIDALKAALVRR